MFDQKQYDVLWNAFVLACDVLQQSELPINETNSDMLGHKVHGSLKGYFLMKAEQLVPKDQKTNV